MPKTNNIKNNSINIRLGDEMFNSLEKCCKLLGVNKSDFVRLAINQAVNQALLQGACMMLYKKMQNLDLKNATAEELAEFKMMTKMFESLGNTSALK